MQAWGYFPGGDEDDHRRFLALCRERGMAPGPWLTTTPLEDVLGRLRGGDLLVVPGPSALGADAPAAAWAYFRALAAGATVVDVAGQDVGPALLAMEATPHRGEKVRQAMARRAVRGQVLGRPPFGYRVGPDRRLEVDPQEGEVVRLIFRLYVGQRLGLRRLAQHLNALGLRTRTGKAWTVAAVRDVLRNRAYVGTYRRFGVRVPASHPALVSHDDFQKAQERLQGRGLGRRPRQNPDHPFPLAGLAFCAYCGGRMVGVRRRQSWRRQDGTPQEGSYRYYQCGSRLNRSLCDYHTWRADDLERRVVEALSSGQARPGSLPPPGPEDQRLRRRLLRLLQEGVREEISFEEWREEGIALATAHLPLPEEAEARAMLAAWHCLPPPDRRRALLRLVERVEVWDDRVEVVARP